MARGTSTFKQRDVARAMKALRAVGIEVARVEIDKAGKLIFILKDDTAQSEADTEKEVAALRKACSEAIRKARL